MSLLSGICCHSARCRLGSHSRGVQNITPGKKEKRNGLSISEFQALCSATMALWGWDRSPLPPPSPPLSRSMQQQHPTSHESSIRSRPLKIQQQKKTFHKNVSRCCMTTHRAFIITVSDSHSRWQFYLETFGIPHPHSSVTMYVQCFMCCWMLFLFSFLDMETLDSAYLFFKKKKFHGSVHTYNEPVSGNSK